MKDASADDWSRRNTEVAHEVDAFVGAKSDTLFGLGGRALRLGDFTEDRCEVLRFAEVLVNRGKSHVSHVVEAAQALENKRANPGGWDVSLAWLSSCRAIPLTMRSILSGSTGRLRSATSSERMIFSRSKGMWRPDFFTTISSRSCTRSKVVNRPAQSGQTRRRRMLAESSAGRESLTCVSRLPQ